MMAPAASVSYAEHPQDVLGQWRVWRRERGETALVMVTRTEGGAVRAPGALMAVSSDGAAAGYVSGGCIDADVIGRARAALETRTAIRLRYGAGSPFHDLPLPCGGAIEVAILPAPDPAAIGRTHEALAARRTVELTLEGPEGPVSARYRPTLRLRIGGRGGDALALAKLAQAAGVSVQLALRDDHDARLADAAGLVPPTILQTPSRLPSVEDDPWTAFVLMFHDPAWEIPLLRQALAGPAFYVGAVGGRAAQDARRRALRAEDVPPAHIARVRGPIGLVPSMRDASMLAVSTLADVVDAYHSPAPAAFATTALVMLAAGQSARFEHGDKLLAPCRGQPLIDHAAATLVDDRVARRVAVVGVGQDKRAERLARAGWRLVDNPAFERGQGGSLARGIRAVSDAPGVEAALVLLADMPNVPDRHLRALRDALDPGVDAVFSDVDGVLGPPALFSRSAFAHLETLDGDRGARAVIERLARVRSAPLDRAAAWDVDCVADLHALDAVASDEA